MKAAAVTKESKFYQGEELTTFQLAVNWKRYFRARLKPYLGKKVLEVGAGIGANTQILAGDSGANWVCLEPDPANCEELKSRSDSWTKKVECRQGTLADLAPSETFDTILYIDVLEHIERDGEEMARALAHLTPMGHVVVLSPAHPSLYSAFDKAVGHFRRYTKASLSAAVPKGLHQEKLEYLDSVGMTLSLVNRLLLREANPTEWQITLWDRVFIPLSRIFDPLFGHRLGKSILGVWSRRP